MGTIKSLRHPKYAEGLDQVNTGVNFALFGIAGIRQQGQERMKALERNNQNHK